MGPTVLIEIRRRTHYRVALLLPQGDHDHVTWHEARRPHAEIETVSDYVDQAALSHQVNVHLWVTPQKLQHQRQKSRTGSSCERIDAQHAGRPGAMRTDSLKPGANVL
ncbi:hypothetical protein D3C80_1898570 [compost metagenome]